MRRFLYLLSAVLLALFTFAAAALPVYASVPKKQPKPAPKPAAALPAFNAETGVLDAAGKLSANDILHLQKKINEIRAKRNVGVGIVILPSISGRKPRPVAREYLNKSGYNDMPNGGTLLLLAMQSHDWYFVTDKKMQQVLLDDFATDKIKDKLVPKMRDGDVADACMAYLDIVDSYTEHYLESGSAYSDSDPPPEDRALLGGLGAITAALGAFAAKYKLRMGMSNVVPAVDADAYMRADSLAITQVADEYTHTETIVTHHDSSDDSDSSSSSSDDDGGGGGGGTW